VVFSQAGWERFFGKDGGALIGNKVVGQLKIIATDAVECLSDHAVATFLGRNPWAVNEWRVMPHMLGMPAAENRDRLAAVVVRKRYNRSFHRLAPSVVSVLIEYQGPVAPLETVDVF